MPLQATITAIVAWARATAARAAHDERGSVTETVILVAIFAALALAVGAIIGLKVTDKANSIPTQ
jgi:hypothetical protein